MVEKKKSGNPQGAGMYCTIRSSQDSAAMLLGDRADFDIHCSRWFEYMGCRYENWRDGKYQQEADDTDLYYFHCDHLEINCRESMYDFQFGDTRDDVSYAFVFLAEYEEKRVRTFSFSLDDISRQEMNEYIEALKKWHATGELNVGPYSGVPEYRPWEAK